MPEFAVHVRVDYTHIVEADTADEADQIFNDGEAGRGECTGYTIDSVTTVAKHDLDYWDLPDLRTPVTCNTCGKTQPPGTANPCSDCWLASRKAVTT